MRLGPRLAKRLRLDRASRFKGLIAASITLSGALPDMAAIELAVIASTKAGTFSAIIAEFSPRGTDHVPLIPIIRNATTDCASSIIVPYDIQSDIMSVGVVILFLMTMNLLHETGLGGFIHEPRHRSALASSTPPSQEKQAKCWVAA